MKNYTLGLSDLPEEMLVLFTISKQNHVHPWAQGLLGYHQESTKASET